MMMKSFNRYCKKYCANTNKHGYTNLLLLKLAACTVLLSVSASADMAVNQALNNGKVKPVYSQNNVENTDDNRLKTKTSSTWVLRAEQWELAQTGESILAIQELNQLINAWLSEADRKIEIQYPGGEEGEFWVQQLSDWLVSLGIPSANMMIVPGSGAGDAIKFNLID